jgi:hypothetical protein
MKKHFLACIFFFGLVSTYGQSGMSIPSQENQKFTTIQLKEDFTLLRKVLEEAHPALYKFTSKSTLDSIFGSIDKKINKEMTETEFWVLIAPIFGEIKCGHTRIYPSDSYRKYFMTTAKLFPLNIKIIQGKMFIAKNLSSDSTLKLGSEIVAINKIPATKIISELYDRTWADGLNQTMRYKILEESFTIWYNLIYGESANYTLETISHNSNKKNFSLISGITMAERKKISSLMIKKQPLVFNITNNIAVLSIKTFNSEIFKRNEIDYNKFIDSVFRVISTQNAKKLIIDIRDNNGGDPALIGYLYANIATKEYSLLKYAEFKTDKRLSYFNDTAEFYNFFKGKKGEIFWKDEKNDWYNTYSPNKNNYSGKVSVLINGGSFSSSGFFASMIKYYKRGLLIGEEAGGSAICNDCHDNLVLPNTKIRAEIARCTFSMNLPGLKYNGHGVIPDYFIIPTLDDLATDTDPVLNFSLKN